MNALEKTLNEAMKEVKFRIKTGHVAHVQRMIGIVAGLRVALMITTGGIAFKGYQEATLLTQDNVFGMTANNETAAMPQCLTEG